MHTSLHNLYGPTENTIDYVTYTCAQKDATLEVSIIGTPISNTQVYVLDEYMQPAPIGITGELYLAGAG
jgi:non-ribosomal peptide synthetase component F